MSRALERYEIILLDLLHYAKSALGSLVSSSFTVPRAPLSRLGGPGGTGCNGVHFPGLSGCNSRDVSMAGKCGCVKRCVSFMMYLII